MYVLGTLLKSYNKFTCRFYGFGYMHKRGIVRNAKLTVSFLLSLLNPFALRADNNGITEYKLGSITIESMGAMEPIPVKPYPYVRWAKKLSPTTDASLIFRYIYLKPCAVFHARELLKLKKKLLALPYFSTVSVAVMETHANGKGEPAIADIIIKTKDGFPITADLELDKGALLTITHNNAWGSGHILVNQLFFKKRWGYGLVYEIP